MSAIVVKGLCKTYGEIRALDGLDFQVEPGSIFGFLGPNGAGKTTTLRILAGLARPSSGQALIEGRVIGLDPETRAGIGYLPEDPGFYPWMTAREFLGEFVGRICGQPAAIARSRGDEMLVLVGLEQVADRRIAGYSRGMKQRLGLAQALLNKPRILLLDEPASALDPAGRHDILALIDSLRGKSTVMMSTHILDDVERVCDSVGIIDRGKIIAIGERQELLRRYAPPMMEVVFDAAQDEIEAWGRSIASLGYVRDSRTDGKMVRVWLEREGVDLLELQRFALDSMMILESYREVKPRLEDVFLSLVR